MSRNPFDDVGKTSRGPVPTFDTAATQVDKHIEETVKRALNDPPQVLPRLITGEAYDALKPRSIELIHQDLLDDERFEKHVFAALRVLPNHQERVRAAKAMSRRGAEYFKKDDMEDAEENVARIELRMREERPRNILIGTCWASALFFGLSGLVTTGEFLGSILVGTVCFFIPIGFCIVFGNIWHMGEGQGRSV
jgi:hypothetical protein